MPKHPLFHRIILLLLVGGTFCFFAAGCSTSSLNKEAPKRRYFLPQAEHPQQEPAPGAQERVLKVRSFTASPGFTGRELLYLQKDDVYAPDYYNLYLTAPAAILTREAVKRMRVSGLFGHVMEASGDLRAGYVLEGNLVSLYADFRNDPKAVLEAQVRLLKDTGLEYIILLDKSYIQEAALDGKTAFSVNKAVTKALAGFAAQLEADCRSALP